MKNNTSIQILRHCSLHILIMRVPSDNLKYFGRIVTEIFPLEIYL